MFTGVDGIKESLASVYGSGKVTVANAAMRWMVHHSQLDPKYGGMEIKLLPVLDDFYHITDGIITGGSSLKHINDNLDSFNDGPLDPSKYHVLKYCAMCSCITGVVKAFDQAWQWDKGNCATYYR